MKGIVCASSAGLINEKPIADVNYLEESVGATPIMTIAMLPVDGQILSMESTGKLHVDYLNNVMDYAMAACKEILFYMKKAISEHIRESSQN